MQNHAICGRSFILNIGEGWGRCHITKTLLVMKLTIILLTAAIMNVSAKGLSQTVSFNGKNSPLQAVLTAIEKQTGFTVVYNRGLLNNAQPVSLDVTDMALESFLQQLFKNQPFDYSIENTSIFISSKVNSILSKGLGDISSGLMPPGNVWGRVTNEQGDPLPGANVSIKGTNLIAVTDEKGNYTIGNVAGGEYTLVVTYIGYKNIMRTLKVSGDKNIVLNFEMEVNVYGFNDIVISANLVASKKKEISSAVTTVTAKQIEQLPISNVSELFRGEVPGGNSWNLGPGTTPTYIKLRGEVDFLAGLSTVKIFIDGIEIADALQLTTLPLSSIDHIEILHGPQASTLYGSGATSGVVQIFTKKGKNGGPHINAKLSGGTIASKWVDKKAYQQDHSLSISGGSEGISYNFGGSYFHYDPYWPDGNNTNTSGFGSVKARQGNFIAELTGMYSTRKYRSPLNPILRDSFPNLLNFITSNNQSNNNTEQTLGFNIVYTPFTWWQHNLSIGIDQNNGSYIQTAPRYTYAEDTLNNKQDADQTKKSYRYYTTIKIPTGGFFKSTITAGFDHNIYEGRVLSAYGTGTDPNFSPVGVVSTSLQKYSNTGYYAQGVFGFGDKFFLTAGIRSETTQSWGKKSPASVAPRIGASFVLDLGNLMMKPRIGYGKSIRVPDPSQSAEVISYYLGTTYHQLGNPDLKPQNQTGYDVGFDAEFGKGLGTFEATYYNQAVNNFITNNYDFSNYPSLVETRYLNVGKIKNTGLELAGTLNLNRVKFRFTYSITNSKVADIANTGFQGFYQNGDRIWGVPKSSGGTNIVYMFPSFSKPPKSNGGSISLGANYFGSWVNMDPITQFRDYLINFDYSKTTRDYIISYPAFVLFRLGINYSITKNVEAFLTVNNLFNSQKFENNNITPTQSRITMLGIHVNY